MLYAAHMVPEISDRIVEIDRAMRWGYANALGPFELWDALGFEATARRIEAEGRALPENVQQHAVRRARNRSIARPIADRQPRTEYFDLAGSGYQRTGTAARHHRPGRSEARARRGEEERRALR